MSEIIEAYLSTHTNTIRKALYMDAIGTLSAYGRSDILDGIQQRCMMASAFTTEENMLAIDEALKIGLQDALLDIGLSLTGDVEPLNSVASAFLTMVNFEDHESILNTLDSGLSTEEIITDLLDLVDPYAAANFLTMLDSQLEIPEGVLSNIRIVHEKQLSGQELPASMLTPQQEARFRKVRGFVNKYTDSIAAKLIIEEGLVPGLPLLNVLGLAKPHLLDMPHENPEKVAIAAFGLVLISSVADEDIVEETKLLVEEIYDEGGVPSGIQRAIDSLLP